MTQTGRRRQWIQRYNPDRKHATSRDDWATPPWVIDLIEDIFDHDVTIDAAAEYYNRKAELYFSIEKPEFARTIPGWLGYDGLSSPWHGNHGGIPDREHFVFLNPPYHAEDMPDWIMKAHGEYGYYGIKSVLLFPAHTDRPWFNFLGSLADAVINAQGRISFEGTTTNNTTGSILATFGIFPRLNPWHSRMYSLDLSAKGKHARQGIVRGS